MHRPVVPDYLGISSWQGEQRGRSITIERGQSEDVIRGSSVGATGMCCVVSLSRRPTVEGLDVSARPPPRVIGRVSYLPEGDTVDFDWLSGTTIAIPSGDFSLRAIYPESYPGEPSFPQRLTALVAPGFRPASAGPLAQARLTELYSSPVEGLVYARVPPRAIGYSIALTQAYPVGGALYEQIGGWVGGAPLVVCRTMVENVSQVFPLVGDAAWLRWTNVAPLLPTRIVWSLSL